jgi:hypothetical protein
MISTIIFILVFKSTVSHAWYIHNMSGQTRVFAVYTKGNKNPVNKTIKPGATVYFNNQKSEDVFDVNTGQPILNNGFVNKVITKEGFITNK